MQLSNLRSIHDRGAAMLADVSLTPWTFNDEEWEVYAGEQEFMVCDVTLGHVGDGVLIEAAPSMLSAAVAGLGAAIVEIAKYSTISVESDLELEQRAAKHLAILAEARAEAFAECVRAAIGETG